MTGLSVLMNRFSVSGTAIAASTFYPLGFHEGGQSISGSAKLVGGIEFRGQGFSKSSGTYLGFVDSSTNAAGNAAEVTQAKPYAWGPDLEGFRLVGCAVLAIGPERRDLA